MFDKAKLEKLEQDALDSMEEMRAAYVGVVNQIATLNSDIDALDKQIDESRSTINGFADANIKRTAVPGKIQKRIKRTKAPDLKAGKDGGVDLKKLGAMQSKAEKAKKSALKKIKTLNGELKKLDKEKADKLKKRDALEKERKAAWQDLRKNGITL